MQQNDKQVVISGKNFRVAFDRADGTIAELSYGGKPVLMPGGGPKLHVWRAPHRNDDNWAAGDWSNRGLNALVNRANSVEVKKIAPDIVQVAVNAVAENRNGNGFDQQITYTVSGDGSIAVDQAVDARGERFVVARMGVRMFPDANLSQFTYLGRGPMENYSDRKRGSDIGLYSSTVKDQLTPYVRPMECGNHEDVRWAALTGSRRRGPDGRGTKRTVPGCRTAISRRGTRQGGICISTSSQHRAGILLQRQHVGRRFELHAARDRLNKYIVYSDPIVFSYVLRPIPAGTKNLAELARQSVPARVTPVEINRDAKGRVTLSCATPGASITYSIDDGDMKPYTEPFTVKQGKLIATAAAPGYIASMPRQIVVKPELDRSKWKIVSADSFEPGEGLPEHAIDNDPNTFWHSRWSPDPAAASTRIGDRLRRAIQGSRSDLPGSAGNGKRPNRQLRNLSFQRLNELG